MSYYLEKLLDGATSTGPGTAFMFDSLRQFVGAGFQVSFTGSPSDVEVQLQGTIDGVYWTLIGNWHSPESPGLIANVTTIPILGVRANLIALTGGSSPAVDAWFVFTPRE